MKKLLQFGLWLWLGSLAGAASSSPPYRPNIILITIDTVRADHLGCYGARDVQTPTLDGLARDGVVFDRAISQVPLTWPSHAVILTGTYPFQNGVQDFTGQPLSPQFRSVAQVFKQQGYATGAVVSAFVLDRSWGLARGFDFYDDAFSSKEFQQRDIGLVERHAQESVSRALKWMRNTHRPFFFWLHLYDPHSPYDPPEPFATQFRNQPYDGEIAYADHELGRLVSWLKQAGVYDRTGIVFLSDHGESLGEHGEQEHGFFVYNSTIRIPLIVKPPAGRNLHGKRNSAPAETTAVAATLLDLAGFPPGKGSFEAQSLLRGDRGDDAAYSETFYPFSSFGWSPLHSLETSRYQYIDAPVPELYDLDADPQEKNNLASQQTATVGVLKDKLQRLLKNKPFQASPTAGSMSPDVVEKLQALGYVAYRSPVPAEALASGLADPKDKLPEFNAVLKAQDALRSGDLDTGKQLLAKVGEQEPKLYTIPFMLGEAELRQEHWQEAENQFRHCLALNPSFDQAMTGLAHALFESGSATEARQWISKAVEFNPQNYRAWYELASSEAKTNASAAEQDYTKAVSIQPNFAPLQRDLGMFYYHHQRYADAAAHLAKAIELGGHDARTYNFLGISYRQSGQLQKALTALRSAIRTDPTLAEAHLNLGYAYQGLNRTREAAQEYKTACTLQAKFCGIAPGRN